MSTDEISKEIYEELDNLFHVEPKLPGDITTEELMERYELSKESVRIKMKTMLDKKIYQKIKVTDADGKRGWVYRKVK